MLDNGFAPEFSDAVFEQLRQVAAVGEPEFGADIQGLRHFHGRRSIIGHRVIWIRSSGPSGLKWRSSCSGRHSADVDARVPKGSPIDDHARQNTVTVYTQSKIFPMLPEELSTDITSLNEGEDRLAVVADMTVKENGDVPVSDFFRAFVRNHAKFSYEEIGEWFDEDGEMPDELRNTPS